MEDRVREWIRSTAIGMTGTEEGYEVAHMVLVEATPAVLAGEYWNEPEVGATHLVRWVLREPGLELVDGDEWWLEISTDSISLLTEPDVPAFRGGELEDAVAWCDALRG